MKKKGVLGEVDANPVTSGEMQHPVLPGNQHLQQWMGETFAAQQMAASGMWGNNAMQSALTPTDRTQQDAPPSFVSPDWFEQRVSDTSWADDDLSQSDPLLDQRAAAGQQYRRAQEHNQQRRDEIWKLSTDRGWYDDEAALDQRLAEVHQTNERHHQAHQPDRQETIDAEWDARLAAAQRNAALAKSGLRTDDVARSEAVVHQQLGHDRHEDISTQALRERLTAKDNPPQGPAPYPGYPQTYMAQADAEQRVLRQKTLAELDDMTPEQRNERAAQEGVLDTTSRTAQLTGLSGEGPVGLNTSRVETTHRVDADNNLVTETDTSDTAVTIGDGINLQRSRTKATQGGDSATTSVGGGLVVTEDGERGIRYSSGQTHQTADGQSRSDSRSVQLTDRGVGYNRTVDRTGRQHTWGSAELPSQSGAEPDQKRQTMQGTAQHFSQQLTNGHVRLFIAPIPDTTPPLYQLQTDIQLQVGGTGGLKASARAPDAGMSAAGSVSAGGSVTVQFVYTHQLTADEIATYRTDLADAAEGGGASKHPEFGLLASVNLLGNELTSDQGSALLAGASPEAAKRLDLNEAFSMRVSGELHGAASLSSGAVALEASGKREGTRIFSVKRAAVPVSPDDSQTKDVVAVTLQFVDASSQAGKAAVGGALKATRAVEQSTSEGQARTFHLDPEDRTFNEQYSQLQDVWTFQDLLALSKHPDFAPRLAETSLSSQTTHSDAMGIALGENALLNFTETSSQSEEIKVKKDGNHETNSSGSKEGKTGTFISLNSETGSVSSTSSTNGGTAITLEQHSEQTRMSWWSRLMNWAFGSEETKTHTPESAEKGLLERGLIDPKKLLRETMLVEEQKLIRHDLRPSDVDVLLVRAGVRVRWERAGVLFPSSFLSWLQLRQSLVSPSPATDVGLEVVSEEGRKQISRLRALSDFISTEGSDGVEMLNNVLRHWGEQGLENHMRLGEDQDVGRFEEWPGELMDYQPRYARLSEAHLALVADTSQAQARQAADLQMELEEIYDAIESCDHFAHPRARMEMLSHLHTVRADLEARQFAGGLDLDVNPKEARSLLTFDALNRIGGYEQEMREFKKQERVLLEKAETNPLTGHPDEQTGYQMEKQALSVIVTELAELHEFWVVEIRELRSWYREYEKRQQSQREIPHEDWLVSSGPGKPRNPETEPDGLAYLNTLSRLNGFYRMSQERRKQWYQKY